MSESSHTGNKASNPDREAPPLFRVINQLIEMNVAVTEAATYDALTGTLNGSAIRNKAQEIMNAGKPMVVTVMDMNRFKQVNDRLGHEDGDDILRGFGAHLTGSLRREGDAVGHIGRPGGDEFVSIEDLTDSNHPEEHSFKRRADNASNYLNGVVAEFVDSQSSTVRDLGFDVAIGHAFFDPSELDPVTGEPEDLDSLFRRADKAMYFDKAERRLEQQS